MQEASGFPCPRCSTAIKVEVTRLLMAAPVFCSGCGLRLELDVNASAGALEAARSYQAAMNHACESRVLTPVG